MASALTGCDSPVVVVAVEIVVVDEEMPFLRSLHLIHSVAVGQRRFVLRLVALHWCYSWAQEQEPLRRVGNSGRVATGSWGQEVGIVC